jgi:hypothetical protein
MAQAVSTSLGEWPSAMGVTTSDSGALSGAAFLSLPARSSRAARSLCCCTK